MHTIRIISSLLLVLAVSTSAWDLEILEQGREFNAMTPRSLRLDSYGNPHLAYGEYRLYYAWFDGDSWIYEIADSSTDAGSGASLVLGANNSPHISYHNSSKGSLEYAHKDQSGWAVETVDQGSGGAEVGHGTSIELDASGYPHISYRDATNNELKYAYQDGEGWHLETVGQAGNAGRYATLCLSEDDDPHISYWDDTVGNGMLKYAVKTGAAWDISVVDSHGGSHTCVALDDSGYPHISYSLSDAVKYAYLDSEGWHYNTLATATVPEIAYRHTAIALDSNGHPHINYNEYYPYVHSSLYYIYYDGSTWQPAVRIDFDYSNWTGVNTSIALDDDDAPHMSYNFFNSSDFEPFEPFNNGLKYATLDWTWQYQVVDRRRDMGRYTSIALGSLGDLHISYYGDRTLRHASNSGFGWSIEVVDDSGDVGRYSWLAIDADGRLHIAYQDHANQDLKYAFDADTGWEIAVIDEAGEVGKYLGLSVDSDNYPHIAYYDVSNSRLKYAYKDEAAWQIVSVENTGAISSRISIAMDSNDRPHISYRGNGDVLRYAYHDGESWSLETVDNGGEHTSITMDTMDYPHISHYASGIFALRYVYRDATGWNVETVDTGLGGGRCTSIELDELGFPRISYRYPEGHNWESLKYAFKDISGWDNEIVDDSGYMGKYSSLALDPNGYIHISYFDRSHGYLKYARGGSASIDLSSTLDNGTLILSWSPTIGASEYWVFGAANQAHFLPGTWPDYEYRLVTLPSNQNSWVTDLGVGDQSANWCYLIIAASDSELEIGRSNRVGEFDFEGDLP